MTTSPYVLTVSAAAEAASIETLGGKASSLARLERAELPVPRWFCVTTAAYDAVTAPLSGEIEVLLARAADGDEEHCRQVSEQIRDLYRGARPPAAVIDAIVAAVAALPSEAARLAVRSSAVGEDSATDSFAGNLESYLHVPRERVLARVLDCFASGYTARALRYRQLRAASSEVKVAVVVQVMVDSAVSGVLFTANPTSGERGELVIAAGYGLGEGIVADRVETDTFYVDRATGEVREARITPKRSRIAFDSEAGAGTRTAAVDEDMVDRSALGGEELARLVEIGEAIEAHFGCPQDIEWALDQAGALHVTQARPITTLPPPERGRERIFDNSNIIEGYPDVTTPLTFSFVRAGYEMTFRRAARAFGVPAATIERHEALFRHMVGLIDGRIYYDLLNWYGMLALIPIFDNYVAAWEQALGLQASVRQRRDGGAPRPGELLGKVVNIAHVTRHFLMLDRDVRRFERDFGATLARFRAVDLAEIPADEALTLYEEIARELLARWEITLINDWFTFTSYDLLGKLIARWGLDGTGALQNDLLCGVSGVKSVEPVRSLLDLAGQVRRDAGLRRIVEGFDDPHAAWARLEGEPRWGAFITACLQHLERYGDRTFKELKLETPRLDEDPPRLLPMLRSYLAAGVSREAMEERERRTRQEAEARVRRQLRPDHLALFWLVLQRTRAFVKHRENMRLARTRAFGIVRRIFLRIGDAFAQRGILGQRDDIFYLGVEEIEAYIRGAAICRDLRQLVAMRRAEFERYRASSPGARIRTTGIVYANRFGGDAPPEAGLEAGPEAGPAGEAATTLTGLGCAPGVARGRARIVLDPEGAGEIAGQILVAPMTDPGWVFLMVPAAGLVVERGSPLSHTAIIGRELGIPTVVAVEGATRLIADGQEIELDGSAGVVRLL
jgi:pyruvate,water dikinase